MEMDVLRYPFFVPEIRLRVARQELPQKMKKGPVPETLE
jgi:hypothetical protein